MNFKRGCIYNLQMVTIWKYNCDWYHICTLLLKTWKCQNPTFEIPIPIRPLTGRMIFVYLRVISCLWSPYHMTYIDRVFNPISRIQVRQDTYIVYCVYINISCKIDLRRASSLEKLKFMQTLPITWTKQWDFTVLIH